MRMRIAGAHQFAAVFKDLDVADPRNLGEQGELLDPGVNHATQILRVHSRNGEIVTRGETQNAAEAAVGLRDKQAVLLVAKRLSFGQERGKIIVEGVSSGVLRSLVAAGALVSRTQVAAGIVSGQRRRRKLFYFSLPRALGALR